jgi:phosphoribosylformylglycinamidine cyclo-ligase
MASSGLHTNGYSLARRVVRERMGLNGDDAFPGEDGASVADVLLRVHRSYLGILKPHLARLHALAHITGGGIPGNLNRVLPPSLDAVVHTASWVVPNVFERLAVAGGVPRDEMFRAFNMGVGMHVLVSPEDAQRVIDSANAGGVKAWHAGEVVPGSGAVRLDGR